MKTNAKFQLCNNFFSISLIFIIILFNNCTGPEGPMGPEGPTGEPGIANVVSIQYKVLPKDWTGNINGYTVILSIPEITSAIYDHGAVLVYLLNEQDPNNKYFNMLPYTYVDNNSIEYMDFDAYVGQVNIKQKWTDNGINTTTAPTGTDYFKIVIAEGTPLSVLKQNVNVYNYNAVAKYLGII